MDRGSPKRMKSHLCIPRLKANTATCTAKSSRLSPMTLLERFREAVFRLMMLSALSKATHHGSGSPRVKRSTYNYHPAEPDHHSEAVADCIEFIKKTSLTSEENRNAPAASQLCETC